MAVKVDHHQGKSVKAAANTHHARSTGAHSSKKAGKKTDQPNVFKILLNELKLKQSHPEDTLRNKPASSQLVEQGHQGTSKNSGTARHLAGQDVNNLSAATLIALAAISSGPNRLADLHQGVGARPISAVAASGAASGAFLAPGQQIGALSAHFESGEKGPSAIGYDDRGGTSYGTYQIASKPGTMKLFLDYLSERAPDLAGKLKAAGPANTGSRTGKMPEVWKKVAAADADRFGKLQYDFIEKTHYQPALEQISARTGLDISKAPRALQEVLWSTAVQHGPTGAAKIFSKAIKQAQDRNGVKMAQLIGSVYNMRAGQFNLSESGIRNPSQHRFAEEGKIALAMLSDPFMNSQGVRG